jgi:uncharacterized protein
MKIVIPGGSGQVGGMLARAFTREGHEVVVLGRSIASNQMAREVVWDAKTLGDWASEIDGADAVINLAGRSVNCRYTPEHRRQMLESRVESTRVLGEAIRLVARPPRAWLNSSTATIYAHRYDAPNDEATGIIGGHEPGAPETWNFSIGIAKAWEQEFERADTPRTRKLALRSAMVMSPDRDGVFDVLLGLARRGLGGRMGDGRQFISWIHEHDFVRAVKFLLERATLSGPVNLASPNPVPNAEFMRALREAAGIPFGLNASEWMLEIGARAMRTETELVLKSRRVIPGRLLAEGFRFEFPDWPGGARDLVKRWRAR